MPPATLSKRFPVFLFLAVIVFYLYGLGHLPLVGPDEPRYAQVAREMFLRRDLITPTLGGHTWFEKPALLYWMMISAFRAFGVSEWSARLGSAVSGLLTIVAVWFVGRRLESKSSTNKAGDLGFISALVAATCLGLIVFSRAASFDIVITMTTAWALTFFFLQELAADRRRRIMLLVGFYSLVGLSLIAKGLIGAVLPFGVVTLYYVMRREWPARVARLSLVWGAPLALAVAAIWYGPVIYRHGWTFVDEFVVQHHFARYLSNKYRHPQPVYFYLLVVALLTLPWTALLLEALAGMRSWRWRENEAVCKARVFCLAWLALPILFFSFSGSKLPGYILPVVPAASLLISECMARKHSRWAVRATGLICILLGAAGLTYAARTGSVSLRDAGLTTLPLFIGGISAIVWRRLSEAPYMMVGGAILLTLVVVLNCGAYSMAQRESVRELLKSGATRGYGSTPVFARRGGDRTAEFYASGRVVYDADGEPVTLDDAPQILSEAHKRGEKILVLVPLDSLDVLRQLPEVEVIGDNGEVALIGVRNE